MTALEFALAVLPTIVLIGYIYWKDRVEKEPWKLIIRVFVLGALSCIPAMILELLGSSVLYRILPQGTMICNLAEYFLVVALSEEFVKFMAVRLGVYRNPEFNHRFDAVVYCVAAALGFATLENILYVAQNGLGNAIMRAVTAVPHHAIDGLMMALYVGPARAWGLYGDKKKEGHYLRLAILLPVLNHGFYDFAITSQNSILILAWLLFIVVVYIWAFIAIRRLSREDQAL